MHKWITAGIAVVGLLVGGPGASGAAEKVTTLEFSTFTPALDSQTKLFEEWGRELEKRTKGRVKVNLYPNNALTPPNQTFDSVIKGICDIGFSATGYTPGRFPLTDVMDLPFGNRTAVAQSRLQNAFYKRFQPKEFSQVKVLWLSGNVTVLHTKKPIRTLEDLQGVKVRSIGVGVNIAKSLGAVPLNMPITETYDALRKGVADGIITGMDTLERFKLAEVTQYTTEHYESAQANVGYVAMNKAKWESFPPDIQAIIDKLSEEFSEKHGRVWDAGDDSAKKFATGQKHTFIRLSEQEEDRWAAKVAPLFDAYVKEKSALGLPAKEAVDFCREWVKKNKDAK
ncbi:MAG: TRAP transporter substrate-binding protein [Deltaproteobacteria bacterium]|nr:TRAP transporter substrate-binding protein [Deltaproteobacteria bacterium]